MDQSREYFETHAGDWDSLRMGYFDEALRDELIAKVKLGREMTAADVGGGTGFITQGLALLVKKVFILDGSQKMLDVARQNLSQFSNVEFLRSDAEKLDLPDNAVDVVFANMYLHHCPDPLAAIREMVRILKPGGRFLLSDLDTHDHAWMKTEMADVWMGFERSQVELWMKQARLEDTKVDCSGQSCCACSEGQEETAQDSTVRISIFIAEGKKPIG